MSEQARDELIPDTCAQMNVPWLRVIKIKLSSVSRSKIAHEKTTRLIATKTYLGQFKAQFYLQECFIESLVITYAWQ